MAAIIEWVKSLPKKPISSAVIFLNDDGKILLVKPSYRDGWQLPGGVIEALESPTEGAVREVHEEIGLTIDPSQLQLVGVTYGLQKAEHGESYDVLYFTFVGGQLTPQQIKNIKLQESELTEWHFYSLEEAMKILTKNLQFRVKPALKAYKNQSVSFLEYKNL